MKISTTVGQRLRKRHSLNPQLRLWHESRYFDMAVQTECGPLIENYLETTLEVMHKAINAHSMILAVPVLLRNPKAMPLCRLPPDNRAISRFMYHLHWELGLIKTTHAPDMRHLWCREQEASDKPHYHTLLFFNGDALKRLGNLVALSINSIEAYVADCLYHRIVRAWAWAIGWPLEQMQGLVDVSEDNITDDLYVYHFHRNDNNAIQQLFYAASYLCKAHSKPIGDGFKCFKGSHH